MMLSTHAVAGAAVAELFPNHPVLAFVVGFASHFVLDSLPHWDYKLRSARKNENPLETDMELGRDFIVDIGKIAVDNVVGFAAALAFAKFTHLPLSIAFIGACGGVIPDALQFVYFKTRSKLLEPLQRFHIWIQEGRSLHIATWKGISLQAALVIVLLFVVRSVL